MLVVRLLLVVSIALASNIALGQSSGAAQHTFGYIEVTHEHVPWPTPESLVAQLRSVDSATRLQALRLLGLTDTQAHRPVWSQSSPATVTGHVVIVPDQIQLAYAALNTDSAQQAVVSVQVEQMDYVAVGVVTMKGWKRVAVSSCWCKYEMHAGENSLEQFVQLVPVYDNSFAQPQRYELVLRASGGGTGIYVQDEAHFRYLDGKLRRVLAFSSRKRSCPPMAECTEEKRSFHPTLVHGRAGGVLVESRSRYPAESISEIEAAAGLKLSGIGNATCRVYEWNKQNLSYTRSGTSLPCQKLRFRE